MYHQSILAKHFTINTGPQQWISLEKDRQQLPGFNTARVAKLRDGHRLYFTIGETQKGKKHHLSATIEAIIQDLGLTVIREPTTAGNLKHKKLYVGFDLTQCQPNLLDQVLRQVQEAIKDCE